MPTGRAGAETGPTGEGVERIAGKAVAIEDVADAVEHLIAELGEGESGKATELAHGLASLAEYIQSARAEIAAIRPDEVKQDYLPRATDELDAIVEATAEATNGIMDAVELVEDVMGRATGADADKLMDATTRIYEACTFQDITGQRITKVVRMLKHIEEKIDAMLGVAPPMAPVAAAVEPTEAPVSDEDLLNGPGLKNEAKSQAEIDALLASFD